MSAATNAADAPRHPVALVTGSSRGIGAETARQLAAAGCRVVVNYREKRPRADKVVASIGELGGTAIALGADLTKRDEVHALVDSIGDAFGRLDIVVLNASGGMERDVDPGYAMRLNRDAQVDVLDQCSPLLSSRSRVVFVTSHQAHFFPDRPVPAAYEPVAVSKRAGEDAVRAWCSARGLDLAVVSGDMIEGTVTVTLLERKSPGTVAARLEQVGSIPTIPEFAAAIVAAALGPCRRGPCTSAARTTCRAAINEPTDVPRQTPARPASDES